jgi:hypothetical protein
MSEHEQPPVWARQEGEPLNWYARFEAYRLAGPQRSLIGTYQAERVNAGKSSAQKLPGSWAEAAEKWHWRQRCETWDMHQLERQREAAELAYEQALAQHQARAREFAERAHTVSTRMLELLAERLNDMPAEELGAASAATWARAAAAVGGAAVESEAEALATEKLLQLLEEHEREQSKQAAAQGV